MSSFVYFLYTVWRVDTSARFHLNSFSSCNFFFLAKHPETNEHIRKIMQFGFWDFCQTEHRKTNVKSNDSIFFQLFCSFSCTHFWTLSFETIFFSFFFCRDTSENKRAFEKWQTEATEFIWVNQWKMCKRNVYDKDSDSVNDVVDAYILILQCCSTPSINDIQR